MLKRIASLLKFKPPGSLVAGLLMSHGTTVPTDASTGYEPGCLFLHIDGAAGTALYVNEGTLASCDFNAVECVGTTVAAKTITALTSTTAGITTVNATTVNAATVDASGAVYAGNLVLAQGAPAAIADGDTTITIANLLTKTLTMAATQARSPILPTGTLCDAGVTMAIGEAFDWNLINLAAGASTITLQAGDGHTVIGAMALAQNVSGHFRTRKTAANTFVTYRVA